MGSKDINVTDSIDFCDYFVQQYGEGPGKTRLKNKLLKLEQDLRNVAAWTPLQPIHNMVATNHDDLPEFHVSPWQFGFTEKAQCQKGSPSWSTSWTLGTFMNNKAV